MNLDKSIVRVDLFNHFSKYGKVKEIHIQENSRHSDAKVTKYGTVIFENSEGMTAAFERGLVANWRSTHTIAGKEVVCCTLIKVCSHSVVFSSGH